MANWAALQEQLMGKPVAKRAKHGIHFQNNDGSITANFSGKPCHFQDTDGLWKPIDTKLLPLGDGYYGCPHSKVKVKPDGTVAVAGTNYVQYTQLPSGQTGLVDNDKLVRKFSFGEQRMWVTEDGFRSEIQLNRIPTLTEARKLIATESGTLSKEYLKSLTTATDANGDTHTYSTLTAFRTWLAQAQFPVVIDPDFAYSSADCRIYGGDNANFSIARSNSLGTDVNTEIGVYFNGSIYYVLRTFENFNTSSIDDGATITQVNLKLVAVTDASAVDTNIYIVKNNWSAFDTDRTNTTKREAAYDACLSSAKDDNIWRNTSGMSTNTQYASGNLATDWVSKTGVTYYSLVSSHDYDNSAPAGHSYIKIGNYNHATESYRPVLTVTYTAGGIAIPIVQYYNRLRRN